MRFRTLLAIGLLLALGACNRLSNPLAAPVPQQVTVTILADGETRLVTTSAATVAEALKEAQIHLGALDRVEPGEYLALEQGMTIRVIRIIEQFESVEVEIPFEQKVVRNEALPRGDRRMLQAGRSGKEEIVYRIEYQDGEETDRRVVRRAVIEPATDEMVMIGVQGAISPVVVQGTLAYISGGNAVVMRTSSNNRDTIVTSGNLDGRVFSISPDGKQLLYSQSVPITAPLTSTLPAFNSLWVINTTRFSGPALPVALGLENILWADWSPDGGQIAYSTAVPIPQPPGWEANNDIWLGRWDERGRFETEELLEPSSGGVYGWWGAEYAWSPNGRYLAYGQADEVGYIDVITGRRVPLAEFSVYHTYGEWVWTPILTWSPDSRFVAAVVHGPPIGPEAPEDSRAFDLWVWDVDGWAAASFVPRVGMWGMPAWSPAGALDDESASQIAFLRAADPLESATSRYTLWLMDRDGSDAVQLYPPEGEIGLRPQPVAWSPLVDQVALVSQGDLFLVSTAGGALGVRPLTGDGINSNPVWAPWGLALVDFEPVIDTTDIPAE